jgi:hypothetical protein
MFNRSCDLCAWMDGEYLYDTDLQWLGFVYDEHMWTSDENMIWLGPVREGVLMDQSGRVVLWTRGVHVSGEAAVYQPGRPYRPPRPQRPPRPNRPPRPERPPRPGGGWSPLSFEEWLTGGIITAASSEAEQAPDDNAGPRWVDFGDS